MFLQIHNNSILDIVKCCRENEALDVQNRACFQKSQSSNEIDYLMDLFYFSMVHTENSEDNILSPTNYNITSIGKPECSVIDEDLEVV